MKRCDGVSFNNEGSSKSAIDGSDSGEHPHRLQYGRASKHDRIADVGGNRQCLNILQKFNKHIFKMKLKKNIF